MSLVQHFEVVDRDVPDGGHGGGGRQTLPTPCSGTECQSAHLDDLIDHVVAKLHEYHLEQELRVGGLPASDEVMNRCSRFSM